MRNRSRRAAVFVALFSLVVSGWLPAQGAPPTGGPGRALLLRGTFATRGLPFFPPNVISALGGVYSLGVSDNVSVWFTREPLFFAEPWRRVALGPYSAFLLTEPSMIRRPGAALALVLKEYTLVFELPEDLPRYRAFAMALEKRFAVFFANAKTDAEVSFPAFVDLR